MRCCRGRLVGSATELVDPAIELAVLELFVTTSA